MKRIKKTFFLILLLLVGGQSIYALDVVFDYPNGQNICGSSLLTIKITNAQVPNMGPVNAEFLLNSSMSYDSIWTNVQNSYIIQTNNKLKIFFDTLVHQGAVFVINARLHSNSSCASVNCSQLAQVTDSLTMRYNGLSELFVNHTFLKSPCISYDETEFYNRLQSASVGDTLIRSLVLRNTGAGTFSGKIILVDKYRSNIEIDTVYTTSPAVLLPGIFSGKTGDSTYTFSAGFEGVANASSITIVEKVIIKKCIEDDEGKSSLFIDWGCGNTTCQKINPYPITAQVLKDYKKPELLITPTYTKSSNCIDAVTHYRYVVKNIGTKKAINLLGNIVFNNVNVYSYIVPGSLILSDTAGMTLTDIDTYHNFGPQDYEHSCIPLNPVIGHSFAFSMLEAADSFIVELDMRSCCPQSDTVNLPLTFEDYSFGIDYYNVCNTGKTYVSAPVLANNALMWNQVYEPLISDMSGNPLSSGNQETFEIMNKGFSNTFYKLDVNKAIFQIVLKTDTGLAYVDQNNIYINSSFGYPLYPFKVERLLGASAEGYQDTMIVASFIFPDTFRVDKNFFQRYFSNSSVYFDLKAYCPAPGPITRFTQEIYVALDTNCTSSCNILLSSQTGNISVHCPGCITPGWVAYDYTVVRTTYGERDSNNDRLPDFTTYVKPDLTKIKRNRYTIGDTIVTEMKASFIDGDIVRGKTKAQLENNGPESFRFKYNYMNTTISDGKIYDLNYVKVYINDVDRNAIASGLDSVLLPKSTVQKISNPNDSLPDARYFYDLSLDTLYKYGFNNNYQYDVNDLIRVVSSFTILDPADFYLTTIPGDQDPWRLFEENGFRAQTFRSLMYLTGEKDVPSDVDVDAPTVADNDPALLDSTQVYWCEGYGGVASWIGRKPIITITLPNSVFCKAEGKISVEMIPGKTIFPNPFPFEYRKLIDLDSIKIFIPSGYNLIKTTLSNAVEVPLDQVEYMRCGHSSDVFEKKENGNVFVAYVDSTHSTATQFPGGLCPAAFVHGDEFFSSLLNFTFQSGCNATAPVFYASPEVYYTVKPGNRKWKYKLTLPPSIKTDSAFLQLSPVSNEFQLNQPQYCYPVTLEEKLGYDAYHSFIKVVSLDSKLKADTLFSLDKPGTFFLPDTTGAFRLDTIKGISLNKFNLCLANRCSDNFIKDSIRLYYGYDCNVYPNQTLSNICHKNYITHYFQPADLDIQSYLESPSQIKMCDDFDLVYVANITGIGKVKNFLVNMIKEDLNGIYYKKGTIEYNGTTIKIPNSVIDNHIIDMDSSIQVLKPSGLVPGDIIKMNLSFYTNCVYERTNFRFFAKAVTSSCDTIYDDTLQFLPTTALEYPVPDNITLLPIAASGTNLGGEVELSLEIKNNSVGPTGNNIFVEIPLPSGYAYKQMISGVVPVITDTLLTWKSEQALTGGQSQIIKVMLTYPPKGNCDTLLSSARLIQRYKTACDGQVCFIQSDTVSYTFPFVCTPCPPIVAIGDTCKGVPIKNTLHWNNQKDFYCFEDSLTYKIYFSPVADPYSFNFLAQLTDSIFYHIDLSTFDGCYYVTSTNAKGVESPASNIVCNKTCIDQFICGDLFIANLITHNADGKNDAFLIKGAYSKLRVEILNRWGDRVFLSEDYKNDFTGQELEAGVYYYSVSAGNEKYCNGWIHLIK